MVGVALFIRIDERVEQPELDILNVGSLKVACVEFTHHTAPVLCRILQRSVIVEVWIKVVRTALRRIICEVEYRQGGCCAAVTVVVAVREKFLYIHLTHVIVA